MSAIAGWPPRQATAGKGARWRAVVSAGMAATIAFCLLILGCVFLAVAGPRQSASMRTEALHTELATTSPMQRSIQVSAMLPQLSGVVGLPVLAQGLGLVQQAIAAALKATPLPVGTLANDWVSVEGVRSPVGGAAASAVIAGTPPKMVVRYASSLGRHSRLVAGRYPQAPFFRKPARGHRGGAQVTRTFKVVVTQATASRFGLHPGSQLTQNGLDPGTRIVLDVTGIIQPVESRSAFWTDDQAAAAPIRVPPTPVNPPYWLGVAFIAPPELPALQDALVDVAGEPVNWDFPLNLSSLTADQVSGLLANLHRVATGTLPLPMEMTPLAGNLVVTAGLQQLLSQFVVTQGAVLAIVALLFTGLTVIDLVAVLLAAQLMAERRAAEFALVRARGAAVWQVALTALRDGALAALPAVAAGFGLAMLVTRGGFPVLAWWLAGLTVAASLGCLPLAVAIQHRRPATGGSVGNRQHDRVRPLARRWVIEAALTATAAGGLTLLHDQGLQGGNVYPAAAPVLIAIPAALLVMRVYPLLVRGLLRLSARRAPVTWYMALSRAARAGPVRTLPVFALVIALVLGSFADMMTAAVNRGEAAASWRAVGADAVVTTAAAEPGIPAAAQRSIAAVPGVTHAAAIRTMSWTAASGHPVQIAAVDTVTYSALAGATPWGRLPAQWLSGHGRGTAAAGVVPVLASPAARAILGARPVRITADSGPVTIEVTGTVRSTPAFPRGGAFLIAPLSGFRAATGALPPNIIMLTGPRLDLRQLASTVRRLLPGAVVTSRAQVRRSLADAPLQRGTYLLYEVGIAAAAGLSALILLLALALTASDREQTLTRLAALGLTSRQARLTAIGEALPAVLVSAAAGAVSAWGLAALLGPQIDLSAFTGSGARVPIRSDLWAMLLPAAALAVLAAVTVAAEITAARRRGIAVALRFGT